MSRVVRQSKFRHTFGKPERKDQCYDSIRITKSSWDSTFCSVNPKYVAIITESAGGGSFLVLPIKNTGRVDRDAPLVAGHKAAVLDIEFCPFNDDIIASGSEDCTVKVWLIPKDGIKEPLTEPLRDLMGHQRRVGIVRWHPVANNILLSSGSDNGIFVWNVEDGAAITKIDLPDLIFSISWNPIGNKIATMCKDKIIRIIDPRNGKLLQEGKGHEGTKVSQVKYLKNGKLFTTGFSRLSERQYAVWDENNLNKPMTLEKIDDSNGVMFPFYDQDTNMVYLCGKGDSVIRYFEITDEDPYCFWLNLYSSSTPARGYGYMPKRGVDVNKNEIARIYKLHTSSGGTCEPISFTVPRKSELFQSDLYPDTISDTAALEADDWIQDVDKEPLLMSMSEGFVGYIPPALSNVRKAMPIKKAMPGKVTASATPTKAEPPATADHNSVESETPSKPLRTMPSTPAASKTPAPVATPVPVYKPSEPQEPKAVAEPEPMAPVKAAPPSAATLPEEAGENNEDDIDLKSLMADLRSLKATVKKHEKRITELETKMANAKVVDDGEDDEEDEWA